MIALHGIGRVGPRGRGQAGDSAPLMCANLEALHLQLTGSGIPGMPMQHFGRMDENARRVCLAVALALSDGCSADLARGPAMGIIGTSRHGCQGANLDFYRDYVDHGRQLARGGLFAATLPTTTLAQAAIQFGIQGPLLYFSAGTDAVYSLLQQAQRILEDKDPCRSVAAIWEGRDRTWCAILADEASTGCLPDGVPEDVGRRLPDVRI